MRLTRIHLAIVLTALGVLGAFWAVHAQELFLPPPVLQPDAPPVKEPEKQAPTPAKYPFQAPALRAKPKADPTLIIPPEVFDVPHVVEASPKADPTLMIPPEVFDVPHLVQAPALERKSGFQLTQGVAIPPPMFPAPPAVQPAEVAPIPPPPLPVLEPKPVVLPALPPPEPAKTLIDPLPKDPPQGNLKKAPEAPPTLVFPPPPGNVPGPAVERSKAFVRLRSAANDVTPPPLDILPGPAPGGAGILPLGPSPGPIAPNPGALLSLQTPAISVEKHGLAALRAGESQTYQIVIRNLGSVPAQQVRIDEEIPAGAKLVSADPQPQWQGGRAIWTLSLAPGSAQVVRLTLRAEVALQLGVTTSAHVSAMQPISTTALRPQNTASPLAVRLSGPERASVGKPVAFDIHVTNPSGLALTGVKMFGYLPEGLNTPGLSPADGREIEMVGTITMAPGGQKILQMPVTGVKPGRFEVRVKLVSSAGETWATASIDVAAETLTLQQAELTRLFLGRDGDLRIEVANGTGKPLRHVAVASLLPEGLDFLGASDRGLFQANHRTVYWLIDAMPAGQTQTLSVRVAGAKAGQYQNVVSARADGIAEIRSAGTVALDGMANLKLRVVDRDNPLELGKETVYEIQLGNTGGAACHNVRLQVQFAPGLIPRSAEGNTRYSVNGQTVVFEPIPSLAPDGQAVYRVSAHAQSAGDLRVRFAVVSDEAPTPLVREISTKVY